MTKRGTKLAKAVKIYLDVSWWLMLISAGMVLLGFLLVAVGDTTDADPTEGVGFDMVMGFRLDETVVPALPETAEIRGTLKRGHGRLNIRTTSKTAVFVILGLMELLLVVSLFVLRDLRALFRAVVQGRPFVEDNARRIRRVGFFIVGWSLVGPLLNFLAAFPILREVNVHGLILSPPIELNVELLFAGLAVLVLAEIFRQASAMQREQSLTI
jgi:hypothetical protein